ncbi:hypothetical protein B0H19DRAFT_1375582 [Mycena capillaripes]|nr:hypothetical protein B0H19DRAFT_1375582 [Mycena capillaripes]
MESATEPDTAVWERVSTKSGGKVYYRCLVCGDLRPRERHRLPEHEGREVHLNALKRREQSPTPINPANELPLSAFVADGARALLASLSAPAGSFEEMPAGDWPEPSSAPSPPPTLLDWGLSENTELDPSMEARGVAQITQQLLQYYDKDPVSEDEMEERSDDEGDQEDLQEPTVTVDNGDHEDNGHGEKRARTRDHTQFSRQWYPWTDRITCTLDILMHLPRSVFSQRQLELFLWLLKVNNVDDVPSVKSMQELNAMLQKLCGIETIAYNGALGHKYHEMSNPKVRPNLEFYPEDTGKLLEEARQGKRWLEEIPSEQTTPMARIGQQDYFIHEPAMLTDGKFCMPIRWFFRDKALVAKCWDLTVVTAETGQSWRVIKRESEVSQERFMKSLPEIRADFSRYNVPDPSKIKDVQDPTLEVLSAWDLTDPTKEYNVHFLCTSNIAPPLEMLDGVLDQLESGQKDGIWAWDSELNELVLLIPSVLALLGDNPMQTANFSSAPLLPPVDAPGTTASAGTIDAPQTTAPAPEEQPPKSRGKRAKETLEQAVLHVKSFVKIGKLRAKKETTAQLQSYFDEAVTLNSKTKIKKMCTASGIKDTFQMVFLDKLFDSYKNKRGSAARQAALDAQCQKLPKDITSPDTPVEILHIVLLGFVKYLWRDLIQNQLQNKDDLKSLLETHLNSFDVSGLGISPLAGHTLVKYSGSLVGRDFRAITQAAPFVVYDLVSKDCLATWVALSKLIPLICEPSIKDINAHVALLTAEINHFLACAVRWTIRWFNKPKFHILLHLPAHIRRFGPAILFAMEAFESFNAIIRAKSVHSNCHAPSRDIALAAAATAAPQNTQLSSAVPPPTPITAPSRLELVMNHSLSREQKDWTHAGPGPLSLVSSANTVTQYLGLDGKKRGTHGICVADEQPPRLFSATLAGSKLPHVLSNSSQPTLLKTNSAMYLDNGDHCALNAFVIAKRPNQTTFIARVQEILQIKGSIDDLSRRPSAILLQSAAIGTVPDPSYGMPAVNVQDQWSLVQMNDILCTVNIQHNCAVHECSDSGFCYVYQEREVTEQTRPVIVHAGPKHDLLLNTCQMRDAVNLQPFRVDSPVLDAQATEDIITASRKEMLPPPMRGEGEGDGDGDWDGEREQADCPRRSVWPSFKAKAHHDPIIMTRTRAVILQLVDHSWTMLSGEAMNFAHRSARKRIISRDVKELAMNDAPRVQAGNDGHRGDDL